MHLREAGYLSQRAVNAVSLAVHRVGGGILAVMMVLTAMDVLLRYIFNQPIKGAQELTEVMLVMVVFLGIAYTATQKGHVRIELLIARFSPRVQAIIDIIFGSVSLILFSLITWQAVVQALEQWRRGLTTTVLYIPIFPFMLMLALGSALLCIVLLSDLFHSVAQVVRSRWKLWEWLVPVLVLVLLVSTASLWLQYLPSETAPMTVGYIGMGALIILLFLGMPIGFAMALIGFVGMVYMVSLQGGLTLLGTVPYATASSYSLSVLPLFLVMGTFAFYSGLSKDLYNTVYKWLGHMPGGLAMATVGACAGFAAVSGSSLATAATMGTVALPEMKRYKYDSALATGCIAAGGSIGILIPPSVVLVIYGIIASQPIGKLFIAGFIPGVLEAVFYLITIYILCKRNPLMGPPGARTNFIEKLVSLKDTWGIIALFMLVIGGLYMGVFTPTEAAGVGAFGAFLFTIGKKQLSWKSFTASLDESIKTTAMAFIILIGALLFGYLLAITRLPSELSAFVAGLAVNRYIILGLILFIYLLLGCVIDSLSMILLTVPVFFPVVMTLGFDPIWFGIIIVRVAEIGLITPPVGVNVFIIKAVAKDVPMSTIFRGIIPFLIADVFHVALLVAVPQISLFLPNLMK